MFQTKLQMRLESGEPKCANCRYFMEAVGAPRDAAIGYCTRITLAIPSVAWRLPEGAQNSATVTDLSVCSKWEMKDGQAKAEAPSE